VFGVVLGGVLDLKVGVRLPPAVEGRSERSLSLVLAVLAHQFADVPLLLGVEFPDQVFIDIAGRFAAEVLFRPCWFAKMRLAQPLLDEEVLE